MNKEILNDIFEIIDQNTLRIVTKNMVFHLLESRYPVGEIDRTIDEAEERGLLEQVDAGDEYSMPIPAWKIGDPVTIVRNR